MKTLNDKELNRIKADDDKVTISQERIKSCLFKIKILELQQKINALELTQEKNNLETLRTLEANAKLERAENLKILAKKKNLKEGWGFNPDSGEIVEN